ncbi:MAG: Gldg family protein [Myxococcota bacterium]|nr:Gldg family protein [Myxococcota bacterium]
MRELGLAGVVAILFGLLSYYGTRELGAFSIANLALGSAALLAALVKGARRLSLVGGPHSRPVILRGLGLVGLALALGIGLERGAAWLDVRLDWTFEQNFALSPAVVDRLRALDEPVTALLFYDPLDPRIRRSRILLTEMAREAQGALSVRERVLDDHPDEADRFAIATSNTVVLTRGQRWERADRPSEGTLFEALYRLTTPPAGTIVMLRGEGQGDPLRTDDVGFAGLVEALTTEGYEIRSLVSAALREVPRDTAALLAVAPERRLLPHALDAIRRYLEGGGRLVALLEPGVDSGLEEVLAEWGIAAGDGLVVDPASGPVQERGAEGLDVIAFNYEVEDVTRGLDRNRMTFFPGVRAFELRKPESGDRVRRLVLSSSRSWQTDDLSWLERRSGRPEPEGGPTGYQTLVAAGSYPRGDAETRIVAFGDSDFASNRYLRTIYNLDLVMNAVNWATEQQSGITLRPKVRDTVQFPVPLNSSVQALYGVGVLLPELLIIAGGIVWLRRRAA